MFPGSFSSSLRPPETFFKVIFWLGYFNSCLNPIIYPCYSREFKQVMPPNMPYCQQGRIGPNISPAGTAFKPARHPVPTVFLIAFFLGIYFCVFRHLYGFFAVGGSGSARGYRHTTTTAGIKAPTAHPSGVAASRRCPPSAPANNVAIQSPAPLAVPPATNKRYFLV